MPDTPKPRRRWFQYSLRMLLFMVLVAIGLSWLAVQIKQAREQRRAVEAIENFGGDVVVSATEGAWLPSLLGEDLSATAVGVFFDSVVFPASDAAFVPVGRLKDLFVLNVGCSPVTDAGLEHLKGLGELDQLDLSGTEITDAGFEHLKGLTRLELLDLRNTKVTKEGARRFQQALRGSVTVWK